MTSQHMGEEEKPAESFDITQESRQGTVTKRKGFGKIVKGVCVGSACLFVGLGPDENGEGRRRRLL